MARLVLSLLALVFLTSVVANDDSSESENVSDRRRNDNRDFSGYDSSEDSSEEEIRDYKAGPRKIKVKLPSGKTAYIKNPADKTKRRSHRRSKPILLALDQSDEEYKLMENEMQSSILVQSNSSLYFSKYNISKIEKVINSRLMKRYKMRQSNIKNENWYLNERMLYFESFNADEVPAQGFNERHANANGTFGAGLYFTKYSSISNQFAAPLNDSHCMTCERKILVSRVTLGKSYKTKQTMPFSHPPFGYYSLQGEASQGGMKYDEYVLFRGEQAYPDYLITYSLIP